MNMVDSSGWLEYFAGGPNAADFSPPLQDPSSLIVPTISIFEVFKVILREAHENEALQAVAAMQKGNVVELTSSIAMNASKISLRYTLPMADSIILSTARAYNCLLWTQDSDFIDIPGVRYYPKRTNQASPVDETSR